MWPVPAPAPRVLGVPPEVRTAPLDPALQVEAGFARLSHGRGDDNVDGLMPDVRGLWVRLQASRAHRCSPRWRWGASSRTWPPS